MTRSFFGQAYCTLEDLRAYEFFLLYYGHGYTQAGIGALTFDELNWHVNKLAEQLKEEKRIRDQQVRKMKSRARARPPRRR